MDGNVFQAIGAIQGAIPELRSRQDALEARMERHDESGQTFRLETAGKLKDIEAEHGQLHTLVDNNHQASGRKHREAMEAVGKLHDRIAVLESNNTNERLTALEAAQNDAAEDKRRWTDRWWKLVLIIAGGIFSASGLAFLGAVAQKAMQVLP